jgi:hypothetical protein
LENETKAVCYKLRQEKNKVFKNTLFGKVSLKDFNRWQSEGPKYNWEENTFSNSTMLRKKVVSRRTLEKIEKQTFLIGSRFSYFNSNAPLMIIPRISKANPAKKLKIYPKGS